MGFRLLVNEIQNEKHRLTKRGSNIFTTTNQQDQYCFACFQVRLRLRVLIWCFTWAAIPSLSVALLPCPKFHSTGTIKRPLALNSFISSSAVLTAFFASSPHSSLSFLSSSSSSSTTSYNNNNKITTQSHDIRKKKKKKKTDRKGRTWEDIIKQNLKFISTCLNFKWLPSWITDAFLPFRAKPGALQRNVLATESLLAYSQERLFINLSHRLYSDRGSFTPR